MEETLERVSVRPAVIPYYKERDSFPPEILRTIYRKLVAQGIIQDLCHDRIHTTEEEFVQYVDKDVLAHIFLDLNGQIVGLAWLDKVDETDTLRKGCASVAFFREYWDPRISLVFGQMFLGQVFNILDFDLVYGVTPEPNRLSRLFCTRLGMTYSAVLRNFVSYRGKTVNGLYCSITKAEFNSKE